MKIIASTGVKGGVGKSTFAILLALNLKKKGKRVVLCDCDIECPNDFVLLKQKLKKPRYIYRNFPKLDKRKCRKCGICAQKCKSNAIFWSPGRYPVFFYDLCINCGVCWNICPFNAIKIKKEAIGKVYINRVDKNFWLVTGISKSTVTETAPIVREAKKVAKNLAERVKADYFIIDTAPGAHCNVIHALIDCDKVYAVTEPTPLGAYDLQVILQLAKQLNLKVEIILNKSNVGNKKIIQEIAKKFGVKISLEIPYSKELIEAYSQGNLEKVVELVKI